MRAEGFLGCAVVENPPADAGDEGLIPSWEDPQEKEMGTHSSTLAWRIPWTEEPGAGATVHGVGKESDMTD